MWDNGHKVSFAPYVCTIYHKNNDQVLFTAYRNENVYTIIYDLAK